MITYIGRDDHNPADCRDTKEVAVTVPAGLSCTGKDRFAIKPIDKCLADIVEALNNKGIKTNGCCCGHGIGKGSLILNDGRIIEVIFPKDWCKKNKGKK